MSEKRRTPRTGLPNGRILPPTETLVAWREQGMTLQEIADLVAAQTGRRVSKSTIASDLSRHGHTTKPTPRYDEEIPWKVATEFQNEYPLRMLRILGRLRANGPEALTDDEHGRLTRWLELLDEQNIVVAYAPTHPDGLIYVRADEVGDGENGIPVRKRIINDDELP